MLISTKGRYALRVLADMAAHGGEGFVPLRDVARRQGISEKYLESIVKALVKHGILSGVRGKGGGYRLLCPPEQIAVGDILRMTEDTLAPVACLAENAEPCARKDRCPTYALWSGLDRVIEDYLSHYTVADLLVPGERREPASCGGPEESGSGSGF